MSLFLQSRTLKFYYKRSFWIHLILILCMIFLGRWQWMMFEKRKAYNIKLLKSSVRVDMVAMPNMTFQELKTLQKIANKAHKLEAIKSAKAAKSEKAPAPSTGKEFIKKEKKVDFAAMLKKMAKKKTAADKSKNNKTKRKRKEKVLKKDSTISEADKKRLNQLVLAGNQISKGENFTGTTSSEGTAGLVAYMEKLPDIVKTHWKLPSYLREQDLRCRIRIYLHASGKLMKAEIIESSGEDDFDQRALEAVRGTQFPSIDGEFQAAAARGEIVLGFPL